MLETIKSLIISAKDDNTSFEKVFDQYLMDVQDQSIIAEISQAVKLNKFDVLQIEQIVQKQHERMVSSID